MDVFEGFSTFTLVNLNQMSNIWAKYVLSSLTQGREHQQIEFRFHKVNYFKCSSIPNDHILILFWSIFLSIQNKSFTKCAHFTMYAFAFINK